MLFPVTQQSCSTYLQKIWDPGVKWKFKGRPSLQCSLIFKRKPCQKHELKSVVWINAAIDIGETDESEAEQIIDYTVHLLQ